MQTVLKDTNFSSINTNGVIYMTSPNIKARHAFTTRYGGVSSGIYKSLNLAQSGADNPDNVKENYAIICRALGISTDDLVCSNQVHGDYIRIAAREDCGRLLKPNPHNADGLISATPGVALMVFTADCVPILMHDSEKNVIAAVHGGWRSTASDIAGKAVQKMVLEFGCIPSDIKAAIGPSISKCCFETSDDVADAIRDIFESGTDESATPSDYERCVTKHGHKFMVDLKETNRTLLLKAGLKNIEVSDECTACLSDKYWSHRKTQGKRGSQVSIIVL